MSIAPTPAFIDPWETFRKAGLTEEILRNSVLDGELERENCTQFDPRGAGGYCAWYRTVGALRERLFEVGWQLKDDGNFPIIISPDGLVAIAVATGDEATGDHNAMPRTKYPRGAVAKSYVDVNQQLLFEGARDIPSESSESRTTWFLLKRRVDDLVYFELSLPSKMNLDTPIGDWSARIFFEPVKLDSLPPGFDDDDNGDDLDIPVTRRS